MVFDFGQADGIGIITPFPLPILGVAHNGVNRIGVENQEVLIIGAGAIGLLATSVAKALGKNVIQQDFLKKSLFLKQSFYNRRIGGSS